MNYSNLQNERTQVYKIVLTIDDLRIPRDMKESIFCQISLENGQTETFRIPSPRPLVFDMPIDLDYFRASFFYKESKILSSKVNLPPDVSYNVEVKSTHRISEKSPILASCLDSTFGATIHMTCVNSLLFEINGEPEVIRYVPSDGQKKGDFAPLHGRIRGVHPTKDKVYHYDEKTLHGYIDRELSKAFGK